MSILYSVNCSLARIWQWLVTQTIDSSRQFIPVGLMCFFGFGLYYLIWHGITPDAYNSFILRLIAMLLCLGLILKDYWPSWLRLLAPIYWYGTLFYIFPFIFTVFTLKNNFSNTWLLNFMIANFFLILLTDWILFFILLIAGIGFGWLFYVMTTPKIYIPENLLSIMAVYITIPTLGVLFIHNKDALLKEKLQTMLTLGVDIAHELRTPLAAINLAAKSTKEYLKDLIATYHIAKEAKLPVPRIRSSQFELLESSLDDISAEINYSNTIINMLLINAEQQNINPSEFQICSIDQCVEEALRRYPFQPEDKKLVHYENNNDFQFLGKEILTVHMLFNLLKNAIYHIKVAHKGEITIWLEKDKRFNYLHFRDTGTGIPANTLPKIFDLFFTKTHHGSGIGLAFCKMVMQSYGGKIECKSVEGEFAEFILSFPVRS